MKLRDLAQFISPRWRQPITCEACHQPFVCGATLAGCWCPKIKLSEDARQQLRARYQHCLCRNCLERITVAGVEVSIDR